MIDYKLFKKIEKYAQLHSQSSIDHYRKRNQNTDKILINCIAGKIGEFECYYSMINAGYKIKSPPDLAIYPDDDKSHAADMICVGKNDILYENEKHIHIKTVSFNTFKNYGISFLIEANDRLVKYPKDNHFYSVMIEESLTSYRFGKWICSTDVIWMPPKMNLPSKLACYL